MHAWLLKIEELAWKKYLEDKEESYGNYKD